MDNAFKYLMKYGSETESAYPYTGRGGTCEYSKAKVAGQVSSYKDVATNSPSDLETAVSMGPVSVAIEADKLVF
jgi:hypothetical protein